MKKRLITLFLIAGFTVSGAAEARVWCNCDKYTNAYFASFTAAVLVTLNQATTSIITAIQQGAAQLSGQLEKKSAALSKTAESQIAWTTQRDIQYKAAELKQVYAPPVVCCSGTATNGLLKSTRNAEKQAAAVTKDLTDRTLNGADTGGTIAGMYQRHVQQYCLALDVEQGRCAKESEDGLGGADVNAATLYQPSDGQMYGAKEAEAAKAFISNIVDPVPVPPMMQAQLDTPQGKTWQMMMASRAATMSLSTYSLSRIYGARLTPEKTQ